MTTSGSEGAKSSLSPLVFVVPPVLIVLLSVSLQSFSLPSWAVVGLIVSIFILLVVLLLYMVTRIGAEASRIRAEGTSHEGRILRIDSTGTSVNDSPELTITVEVRGQEDLVLTTSAFIPFYLVPQIQPGAIVPIFVLDEDFALDIESMKSVSATGS